MEQDLPNDLLAPIDELSRLNDVFFKYCFAKEETKDELLALLNAVLERPGRRPLAKLQLEDREISPDYRDGKASRVDILAELDDGREVNLEVQVARDPSMCKRSLYYWAKIYADTLRQDTSYSVLHPVIMINLLNFNLFADNSRCHREFGIYDSVTRDHYLEDLEIHYIELPKYTPGMPGLQLKLENWLKYFSRKASKEEMEKIAMTDTAILHTLEREKRFLSDHALRMEYLRRECNIRSEITNAEIFRAEGREEGREEGARLIAQALLDTLPVEIISQKTGVPVAEIMRMKAEK